MYKILNTNYTNIPKEDEEQKALVNYLRKNGYFVFATNNENNTYQQNRKYAMIAEVKAKANGKVKGVSDLCVFTDDRIVFIELKRQRPILKSEKLGTPKNKPTKEQLDFIDEISLYNYATGSVAYGCDEAIEKFNKIVRLNTNMQNT